MRSEEKKLTARIIMGRRNSFEDGTPLAWTPGLVHQDLFFLMIGGECYASKWYVRQDYKKSCVLTAIEYTHILHNLGIGWFSITNGWDREPNININSCPSMPYDGKEAFRIKMGYGLTHYTHIQNMKKQGIIIWDE